MNLTHKRKRKKQRAQLNIFWPTPLWFIFNLPKLMLNLGFFQLGLLMKIVSAATVKTDCWWPHENNLFQSFLTSNCILRFLKALLFNPSCACSCWWKSEVTFLPWKKHLPRRVTSSEKYLFYLNYFHHICLFTFKIATKSQEPLEWENIYSIYIRLRIQEVSFLAKIQNIFSPSLGSYRPLFSYLPPVAYCIELMPCKHLRP